MQQPCALGHEAVLARNPFLDFLVGDALAGWLLLPGLMARLARISSIVFAISHFSFRSKFLQGTLDQTCHAAAQTVHCTPSYPKPTFMPEPAPRPQSICRICGTAITRRRNGCILRCRYSRPSDWLGTWPRVLQNKAWAGGRQQEKMVGCQSRILPSGVSSFRLSPWR
jgi:hypothetical protein